MVRRETIARGESVRVGLQRPSAHTLAHATESRGGGGDGGAIQVVGHKEHAEGSGTRLLHVAVGRSAVCYGINGGRLRCGHARSEAARGGGDDL